MRKNYSKLKALEWSQHFSHYKSMGIFPNTQGKVTHKSPVGSCRNSNPSEILWVYLLPARMKKIRSKMKELEWSQLYSLIFLTLKGSLLRRLLWNLAKIQTHPSHNGRACYLQEWRKSIQKMTALEWSQYFSHYKSMGIFPDAQGQLTHKSLVGSCWISNPFQAS